MYVYIPNVIHNNVYIHTYEHTYTSVYKCKQELSIGVPVAKKFGEKIFNGVIVSTDVDPEGKTL